MERASVLFIPVASSMHLNKAIKFTEKARALLENAGLEVSGPTRPIIKSSQAPEINEGFDCKVIFISSGGTSKLAASLAKNKEIYIWAYNMNNSLPSALSVREFLVAEDAWRGKIIYNMLEKAPDEIVIETQAFRILENLRRSRVGLVGSKDDFDKVSSDIDILKRIFKVDFIWIPVDDLEKKWMKISDEEAREIVVEKLSSVTLLEPTEQEILKSLKLYLALKSTMIKEQLSAITIDCFNFIRRTETTPCFAFSFLNDEGLLGICEADLKAAILMLLFKYITGKPAWIANLAKIERKSNVVTLAHCTAATSLADVTRIIKAKHHFESGLSASFDVPLMRRGVTVANLQINPPKMVIFSGKIVESQMEHLLLCRTQARVKLKGSLNQLFEETGNHQILSYGNSVDLMVRIAENVGIKILKI